MERGADPQTWSPHTLVIRAERVITHRKALLQKDHHLYKAQAADVFAKASSESMANLGQKSGTKYTCKKKMLPTYTQEDVDKLVAAANRKQSGVKPLSGFEGLGSRGLCLEDAVGDGLGDDEDVGDVGAQLSLIDAGGMEVARQAFKNNSVVRPGSSMSSSSKGADGSNSNAVQDQGDQSDAKLVRGSSPESSRGRSRSPTRKKWPFLSVVVANSEDDDNSARIKLPSHWHSALAPKNFFAKHNLTRQLNWARGCVKRILASDPVEVVVGDFGQQHP
jgi:hypothetical protein